MPEIQSRNPRYHDRDAHLETIVTNSGRSLKIASTYEDRKKRQLIVTTSDGLEIILWKDDEFDALGQWTQEQVVNRLKEEM